MKKKMNAGRWDNLQSALTGCAAFFLPHHTHLS